MTYFRKYVLELAFISYVIFYIGKYVMRGSLYLLCYFWVVKNGIPVNRGTNVTEHFAKHQN